MAARRIAVQRLGEKREERCRRVENAAPSGMSKIVTHLLDHLRT